MVDAMCDENLYVLYGIVVDDEKSKLIGLIKATRHVKPVGVDSLEESVGGDVWRMEL
jgi:hypothetical protein